jgi:hypothetical protein
MKRRAVRASIIIAVLLAAALSWSIFAQARDDSGGFQVRGGGTSLIEGGTGAPSFVPVITKFAFHWRAGKGHFECLALAPSAAAGSPGSGNFDTNAMYVTGDISSARIVGRTAVLKGSATVTGLGAGSDQAFTAWATRGGPGATLVLKVSGLTFNETLLEGQIRF